MKKFLYFAIYIAVLLFIVDFVFGSWYLKKTNRKFYQTDLEKEYISRNRILHPTYNHGFIPNTSLQYKWGDSYYQIYINSLGFLDKEIREVPLESKKHRVLFLGDSFVEGVGHPYQDTFIGIMEKNLGTNYYEFLNAGAISYSPKLYFNKAKYLIEKTKLKVDEVVIFIDLSDPYDEVYYYKYFNPSDQSAEYLKPWPSYSFKTALYGFLTDHSLLVHTFFPYKQREDARNVSPYMYQRGNWTFDEKYFNAYGKEGLESCKKYMTELVNLLKDQGIEKISIVVYPYPDHLRYDYKDSKQVSFWKDFSEEHSVNFINLFATFFALENPSEYFIDKDVHWTVKGHEMVAKTLIENLSYDREIN